MNAPSKSPVANGSAATPRPIRPRPRPIRAPVARSPYFARGSHSETIKVHCGPSGSLVDEGAHIGRRLTSCRLGVPLNRLPFHLCPLHRQLPCVKPASDDQLALVKKLRL